MTTARRPAIPIHDKRFSYVDAAHTDLHKTFAKVRRQQKAAHAQEAADKARVAMIFDTRRIAGTK